MFSELITAAGDEKQEKFEQLRRFRAVHETAEELSPKGPALGVSGGATTRYGFGEDPQGRTDVFPEPKRWSA